MITNHELDRNFRGVGHSQPQYLGVSGHPRHPQWLHHWVWRYQCLLCGQTYKRDRCRIV